jgi:hypothetical protein
MRRQHIRAECLVLCHSIIRNVESEPRRSGFAPGSGKLGFAVDKVVSGQVFSEYFGFPVSFH